MSRRASLDQNNLYDVEKRVSKHPRSSVPAQPGLASKKVLILCSFEYTQPAYKIIDQSLTESFVASGLDFKNVYFEFMDLARNPGQEYRNCLINFFPNLFSPH